MTRSLLKASDNAAQKRVRAFNENSALQWPIVVQPDESAIEPIETPAKSDESIALRQQLSELDERLDSFRTEAEQSETDAYERGIEEGLRIAQRREAEHLDILSGAAEKSRELLDRHLGDLQTLSLQIAQLSLAKVLGDPGHYPDLVTRSIRHRCQQLSAELVTAIRVSATDFPDPTALAALSDATGSTLIQPDPKLESGACVFDLKLGHYDIGVGSQWERLRALLNEMAQEPGLA